MDRETIRRILFAMIEDCGNLITKTDEVKILREALEKNNSNR